MEHCKNHRRLTRADEARRVRRGMAGGSLTIGRREQGFAGQRKDSTFSPGWDEKPQKDFKWTGMSLEFCGERLPVAAP